MYYFRVCAKVWSHPKLKVALIMNFVAGVCTGSRLKMLLLWEAPLAVAMDGDRTFM